MKADVKILLSYDYNNFEIVLSEECKDLQAVNELRKVAQRLADEAIRQYKVSKEMTAKRENSEYDKRLFEGRIVTIKAKPVGERTVNEVAMFKQYDDENWQSQFDYGYDYDDDADIYF